MFNVRRPLSTLSLIGLLLMGTLPARGDDTPVAASINLRSGDVINDVEIRAVTNGVSLLKGPYGTLQVPLQDMSSIVFPKGDARLPGVVLDSGGYNAELKEMKNDTWSFSLRDVDGGFTVKGAARLRSINLIERGAAAAPASAAPAAKGCNVLEWTYAYEPFGNSNWNFQTRSLALIGPELLLQAEASSRDGRVRRYGCVVACKIVDDRGQESQELVNDRFRVDIKPSTLNVRCPPPPADAKSFTVYLRTAEAGKTDEADFCEGDDWRPLPTIDPLLISSP